MSDAPVERAPILALVRDLFFGARIGEAAKATGRPFKRVSTRSALLDALEQTHPALVVVDLAAAPGDLAEIASHSGDAGLLAFGPHVDAAALRAARAAGFHEAVPNSVLARDLPALLARHLPPADGADTPADR